MKIRILLTAATVIAFAACGDGTGPTMGGNVALSFASDLSAGAAPAPSLYGAAMAGPLTDVDGNVLDITSVQFVLREIELERQEIADCDVVPEPDGCEKFETEPILVDLPLDGSTSTAISITVAPGTYDEVEFDIHKVTGNADDAFFLADHPELDGKSLIVVGTYFDGATTVDFTYESDLNEEQELALDPVLVISEDGGATGTNVTLRFDVSTWFVDGTGRLFNPETALVGEPNENLAETNIRNSIKAFEDKDRDGDDTDES
jgi:hypothetical protein